MILLELRFLVSWGNNSWKSIYEPYHYNMRELSGSFFKLPDHTITISREKSAEYDYDIDLSCCREGAHPFCHHCGKNSPRFITLYSCTCNCINSFQAHFHVYLQNNQQGSSGAALTVRPFSVHITWKGSWGVMELSVLCVSVIIYRSILIKYQVFGTLFMSPSYNHLVDTI